MSTAGFFRRGIPFLFLIWATFSCGTKRGGGIVFDTAEWDFGRVAADGRELEHVFTFTNRSDTACAVTKVVTTCGCTRSEYDSLPVLPGEKGSVRITARPGTAAGEFYKEIYVYTDLRGKPYRLRVRAAVEMSGAALSARYPVRVSEKLRAASLFMSAGNVAHGTIGYASAGLANVSGESVRLACSLQGPPRPYLSVSCPERLDAGETGTLVVFYDLSGRDEDWGPDTVSLRLSEAGETGKVFRSFAVFTEDFDRAELGPPPILAVPFSDRLFREVHPGDTVHHRFTIRNTGRSDLMLRHIRPGDVSLACTPDRTRIPPGEEASLSLGWRVPSREGTHRVSVSLVTNDPRRPCHEFYLEARVTP